MMINRQKRDMLRGLAILALGFLAYRIFGWKDPEFNAIPTTTRSGSVRVRVEDGALVVDE